MPKRDKQHADKPTWNVTVTVNVNGIINQKNYPGIISVSGDNGTLRLWESFSEPRAVFAEGTWLMYDAERVNPPAAEPVPADPTVG